MAESSSAEAPASVAAARLAGDASLMWAEFAGRLRAFVARRVPPGIEPDDVIQEVFVRVVRHLPSLRDDERIEAWLFQIARNTLRDAMRARLRRDVRTDALEIDPPAEGDKGDARDAEVALASCLTPMLASLAEPYRSAVELTSVDGLTQAEAARRAGISVSGMKSRVQRARDQLKAMLLRCCEIDLDRRHGVAAYHLRESAPCGTPGNAPRPAAGSPADLRANSTQCVHRGSRASSRVSGEGTLRRIKPGGDMTNVTTAQDTPRTDVSTAHNQAAPGSCCGGRAPAATDACCARDAEVKSAGGSGCGCGSIPAVPAATKTGCCR